MSGFYRPTQQFNSWVKGLNEVAIVAVEEMTGETLAKFIASKSQREGREITKLDVNLVITFKKKDYEYSKKMTYGYAFKYNEDGKIDAGNLKTIPE